MLPSGDSDAPLADALRALAIAPTRCPAEIWPGSVIGLDRPGLYAWFCDEAGAVDLSRALGIVVPSGLVYVGQTGAWSSRQAKPSAATLGKRIGLHLGRRFRSSTLRRTLAAILAGHLSLRARDRRRLEADGEARLTGWITRHLSVAVFPVESGERLGSLEERVVQRLRPPLNIDHMSDGQLRTRVKQLRHALFKSLQPTDWVLGLRGFLSCRRAAQSRLAMSLEHTAREHPRPLPWSCMCNTAGSRVGRSS